MKKNFFKVLVFTLGVFLAGCKLDKSKTQNFNNHITSSAEVLSADEVYVTTDEEQLKDNTFVYGQKIFTNFENMNGFTTKDDRFYPQMDVIVTSEVGDTVLNVNDLYDAKKGLSTKLKTLYGELILATPIHSGKSYTAIYNIRDSKGEGVLSSEMDFSVEPNPSITVEESGLSAQEIYLFNTDSRAVNTTGIVFFNDKLQFQFEGLTGYKEVEGFVALGLSIKVVDAKGMQIVYNTDAFENTLLTKSQIDEGVGGTLIMTKGRLSNPVTWDVEIWDKNSDARIKGTTQLQVN